MTSTPPGPRPQISLDLRPALLLARASEKALNDIDGLHVKVDFDKGKGRRIDPHAAEVSRDLLRTAEMLRAAAAEVTTAYWQLKGYPDPREELYER